MKELREYTLEELVEEILERHRKMESDDSTDLAFIAINNSEEVACQFRGSISGLATLLLHSDELREIVENAIRLVTVAENFDGGEY
ncbi:hypothetical protein [Staphylococcus felis]|uniref:Uncharacterized protein n=1 Tax=Staphylococcus felis TaxID=46127 RepID=A0ABS0QMF6_9STAP|nr:hypothetical protein [Staphylococcus felis]MBH9580092.1 hypothetical protein [Staphylococcus felis]